METMIESLQRENELLKKYMELDDRMSPYNFLEIARLMDERDELRDAFFEMAPSLPKWAWNEKLEVVFQKYEKK